MKAARELARKKVAVDSNKEEKKHEDALQKLKKQLNDVSVRVQTPAMLQHADEAAIASILQKYIDCVREPQKKLAVYFDKIEEALCKSGWQDN